MGGVVSSEVVNSANVTGSYGPGVTAYEGNDNEINNLCAYDNIGYLIYLFISVSVALWGSMLVLILCQSALCKCIPLRKWRIDNSKDVV